MLFSRPSEWRAEENETQSFYVAATAHCASVPSADAPGLRTKSEDESQESFAVNVRILTSSGASFFSSW
jgi:hypothetical protein